ncbi:YihY/virulence factor BrkB family protein [Enterococcus sp. LJL90]
MFKRLQQRLQVSQFIRVVQSRMAEAELTNSSVVVAYYLLLSLFPLLIAIGNILPFLNLDAEVVLTYLKEVIPSQIFSFLGDAIEDLLTQGSGGLLSISALAALWSASQSINALQIAMNKAYGVEKRGNFIIVRIVSLLVIILFMVALALSTLVFGLGRIITEYLQPILQFPTEWLSTFQTLRWPVTAIGLLVIMGLIYLVVPNAKVSLRSVLPGAIFATVGWMLLSQVFGLYARFFASRVSSYQVIGSFIVLMIWLNIAAMIIILGGIINAVVAEYTTGHEVEERKGLVDQVKKLTGADEQDDFEEENKGRSSTAAGQKAEEEMTGFGNQKESDK